MLTPYFQTSSLFPSHDLYYEYEHELWETLATACPELKEIKATGTHCLCRSHVQETIAFPPKVFGLLYRNLTI